MTMLIHQPSDKFFKQSMADIRVAKNFFETHLPAELLTHMDLSTLQLQSHSFIDEAYKNTEADVVYRVKTRDGIAYLYVLCEQQSNIDHCIAFRLLVYTVRLMEQHLKQHPKSALPVVYPLVVYSGKKVWNAPLDIFELFKEQKALAKQVLLQPYHLVDLHRLDDEDLKRNVWSGIVGLALKNKRAQKFSEFLEQLFPLLTTVEMHDGSNFAKIVLRYVADGIECSNAQLLIEKSHQLSSDLRGEIMTFAQHMEKRGLERGRKEGMQQGMQEKQQIGLKLLKKGMTLKEIAELLNLPAKMLKVTVEKAVS